MNVLIHIKEHDAILWLEFKNRTLQLSRSNNTFPVAKWVTAYSEISISQVMPGLSFQQR